MISYNATLAESKWIVDGCPLVLATIPL